VPGPLRSDTGTMMRSTRSSTASPRETSSSRRPPPIAAIIASLTVQPAASVRICLASVSDVCTQSKRRRGPIGPLSDVLGGCPIAPSDWNASAISPSGSGCDEGAVG
jgi:hypothetical protein